MSSDALQWGLAIVAAAALTWFACTPTFHWATLGGAGGAVWTRAAVMGFGLFGAALVTSVLAADLSSTAWFLHAWAITCGGMAVLLRLQQRLRQRKAASKISVKQLRVE